MDSMGVEGQLVRRRRYASVVVLLLTCLINLCCLTLTGRQAESQLLFFSCLLVLYCLFFCFNLRYNIATQLDGLNPAKLLLIIAPIAPFAVADDDDDGRHSRNSNFVLTNIDVDSINNFPIKLRNVGKYCKDSSTKKPFCKLENVLSDL